MKKFITLVLIIFCLNAVAEKQPEQQSHSLQKLERRVDYLSKTVNNLSIEKNFFQTTLSSQTTTYSIIVTILLAVIGLFSFLIINAQYRKSEVRTKELLDKQTYDFERLISTQKEKFDLVEADMQKQSKMISKALCNTFVSLSLINGFGDTYILRFSVYAAFHAIKHENSELTISCLSKANNCFNRLINSPEECKNFTDDIDNPNIISALKELVQSDKPAISNLAIDLVSKINKLNKQPTT